MLGGPEGFDQGIRLLSAFKCGDQVAFFVVQGEVRQVADLVERGQPELFIAANQDIGMLVDLIALIEFFHFGKGLVGSHNDLDILKVLKVSEDGFGLVFAVLAVRAEVHDHGLVVFMEVVFGQVGCTVESQKAKGRDGREAHEGGTGIGSIGCGLIGQFLSGYELAKDYGRNCQEYLFHLKRV